MTISIELRAGILRLYQAEHWRVGTIARQLHLHRDTVTRVLAGASVVVVSVRPGPRQIDLYLPFIREALTKYPSHTARRLHVMVQERGYTGTQSHFRHLVATVRPRRTPEAYLRLRTLPAEQAQVDWALCRARRSAHYAESPNMPSVCPRSQITGRRPRTAAKETRHSLDAYRFFKKVSNASSGLKVDGVESGGTVLAKTRRFNSRSALR